MVTYASANAGTITHLALGAATFIPLVGAAAAVADAGLYAYEGDYLAASLSMLAVVPGGEILGDAAKLARGGEKAVNVVNDVEKIEKVATDLEKVGQAASGAKRAVEPGIKAGESGGETAGRAFPQSVRDAALGENPSTCVYCRMETETPQVDHVVPKARGGDATIGNAQTACPHCNASKGARDFPVTPPPGYRGSWPPPWWKIP